MDDPGDPLTAKRGRPSLVDSAFEEHRKTITRLWHAENQKLPNVIQLMKRQHGFSATRKQYKKRLNAWGLWKNIRRCEIPHLARIKVHRDAVCKSTRFKLHGVDVDVTKIDRWIKAQRKKLGDDGFMSSIQTEVSTPPEIVYDTEGEGDSASHPEALDESYEDKSASMDSTCVDRHIAVVTLFSNIRPPNALQIPEEILRTIRNYFDTQFGSESLRGISYHGNEKTLVDGRRQLESAFALLDPVLREESPLLLPYLICLHRHIHTSEAGLRLSCTLWDYTQRLSYIVLGSKHPLTRILAHLGDATVFREQHGQSELIARFVANQLETRGDCRNSTNFKTAEAYVIASRIEAEATPTLAEANLQKLLEKLTLQDRALDSPTLNLATIELAYNLHRQNRDQEAKVMLTKLEADQNGLSLNDHLIRSRRLLSVIEAREESWEDGDCLHSEKIEPTSAFYPRGPCTECHSGHHWGSLMRFESPFHNREIRRPICRPCARPSS
ncbi:hypothetical protein BJ875DRAFT_444025 [Amylocarpus encephaloides]|uniref:Clr5 domain-containing protein n=1 Tax=Amylocarpus encephaloides TaxID=45428 RepID=A0A9P8C2X0_9HELO|nr:hypothetical protein BJ875DRAFT_444025 [Amylocarpus encephaloides]